MNVLSPLFNRRWRWMTLLVIAACATTVRLGFWQLDRLVSRRATNTEVSRRFSAPPVVLPGIDLGTGPALEAFAFRPAVARGTFDHGQEVAHVNQVWRGQLGLHLITPLVLEGTDRAVLVDRGWIPATAATPQTWIAYRTAGPVEVNGWMTLSRQGRSGRAQHERLIARLDIPYLQTQISHPLLPVILIQSPDPTRSEAPATPPIPRAPAPTTGEGVHQIVAVQWFIFTFIIGAGYVAYVNRHSRPAVA